MPVRVVVIMRFEDESIGGILHDPIVHWRIHDIKGNQAASNLLSWTFVVLPRFQKTVDERYQTSLDAWLRLFVCEDNE